MSLIRQDLPAAGVAQITLDRPDRRNALSVALRDELSEALDALAADDTIKVVVITGAGDVFSAGFDLAEFDAAASDEAFAAQLWASSDRYHQTVIRFPLVTLASVNGPAIAGGFDLAVCCDLRIGSTTARFSHPERTFGAVVYSPLHDLVGGAVARELCLAGRELSASEAFEVHLLSAVVEPERLEEATLALACRVAEAPRATLATTKAKALRRAGVDSDTATLDL